MPFRASNRQRESAHHVRYLDVRSQIATGDIFLFQGRKPFARLISWGSGSIYSHTGIAAWWGDRLFVLYSILNDVRLAPASAVVDESDGRVDWFTVREEWKGRVDRERLLEVAQEELIKPSVRKSLLLLALRMILGRYRGARDRGHLPPALFSSEYVSRCYRMAGLNLRPDTGGVCTTPGDIAISKVLELRGILHTGLDGQQLSVTRQDIAFP